MKIWAIALWASRVGVKEISVHVRAAANRTADTFEQAVGIAVALCHQSYPQSEGFYGHGVDVKEIPQNWLSKEGEPIGWCARCKQPIQEDYSCGCTDGICLEDL